MTAMFCETHFRTLVKAYNGTVVDTASLSHYMFTGEVCVYTSGCSLDEMYRALVFTILLYGSDARSHIKKARKCTSYRCDISDPS